MYICFPEIRKTEYVSHTIRKKNFKETAILFPDIASTETSVLVQETHKKNYFKKRSNGVLILSTTSVRVM